MKTIDILTGSMKDDFVELYETMKELVTKDFLKSRCEVTLQNTTGLLFHKGPKAKRRLKRYDSHSLFDFFGYNIIKEKYTKTLRSRLYMNSKISFPLFLDEEICIEIKNKSGSIKVDQIKVIDLDNFFGQAINNLIFESNDFLQINIKLIKESPTRTLFESYDLISDNFINDLKESIKSKIQLNTDSPEKWDISSYSDLNDYISFLKKQVNILYISTAGQNIYTDDYPNYKKLLKEFKKGINYET